MIWTKLGMGLLGMAGKELAGSGLLQALGQGLGAGKGGGRGSAGGPGGKGSGAGRGMGTGQGRGKGGGPGGGGCRQADAPALDGILADLLQRRTTVGETVRGLLLPARNAAAGETIDVQALPQDRTATDALPSDAVPPEAAAQREADMEAALRALLASIHHFSDGRVRLRHPLFHESDTFEALHRLLCDGTGIAEAGFNAVTGSALLTYDPARLSREDVLLRALPLGVCLLEWEARHRPA